MLSKIISEENVQAAASLIEQAQRIVIISHIGPDGDAVGSTLGLRHYLTEIGKDVTIILPNQYPSFLSWLPGADSIVIAEEHPEDVQHLIRQAELILLLDLNNLSRISAVRPFVEVANVPRILVDHHIDPEPIADVLISHPTISSTSELVFRLICRMGHRQYINLHAAECIYTGMMTDTGAFTYNSNDPEMYLIVSELIRIGINKDTIYKRVNFSFSENRFRFHGYCMNDKLQLLHDYHTAIITLTEEEMNRFSVASGDTEGIVNLPFAITGVMLSILIREDNAHKKIKISFRSQGNFAVNTIASQYFNGGGHMNAAGGETYTSVKDTLKQVIELLHQYKEALDKATY